MRVQSRERTSRDRKASSRVESHEWKREAFRFQNESAHGRSGPPRRNGGARYFRGSSEKPPRVQIGRAWIGDGGSEEDSHQPGGLRGQNRKLEIRNWTNPAPQIRNSKTQIGLGSPI